MTLKYKRNNCVRLSYEMWLTFSKSAGSTGSILLTSWDSWLLLLVSGNPLPSRFPTQLPPSAFEEAPPSLPRAWAWLLEKCAFFPPTGVEGSFIGPRTRGGVAGGVHRLMDWNRILTTELRMVVQSFPLALLLSGSYEDLIRLIRRFLPAHPRTLSGSSGTSSGIVNRLIRIPRIMFPLPHLAFYCYRMRRDKDVLLFSYFCILPGVLSLFCPCRSKHFSLRACCNVYWLLSFWDLTGPSLTSLHPGQ